MFTNICGDGPPYHLWQAEPPSGPSDKEKFGHNALIVSAKSICNTLVACERDVPAARICTSSDCSTSSPLAKALKRPLPSVPSTYAGQGHVDNCFLNSQGCVTFINESERKSRQLSLLAWMGVLWREGVLLECSALDTWQIIS